MSASPRLLSDEEVDMDAEPDGGSVELAFTRALLASGGRASPRELLTSSGFSHDSLDDFYRGLAEAVRIGAVIEQRLEDGTPMLLLAANL